MTTAAQTKFCRERVDGPFGLHLWIDGNEKITAGNGTFAEPSPNAFSIVQVADCPFSTPACRASCYVHNLEKHALSTHDLYKHNSKTIREIIGGGTKMRAVWAMTLAEWIGENCDGGFRWHVSGDIFSEAYAYFIRDVTEWSAVRNWIYTRSFPYLGALLDVSSVRGGNLAINLSADVDNYHVARGFADRLGLRVCYMATVGVPVPADLRRTDVIFPDYPLRQLPLAGQAGPGAARDASGWYDSLTGDQQHAICPVDFYGKADNRRCGPCRKCLE